MNIFKHDDRDEFINNLLKHHHPRAVQHFITVYSGQPGVGMMRAKVNGEDASIVAYQQDDDSDVHVLFIVPTVGMKIESLSGEPSSKTVYDINGDEIKSH